MASLVLACLVLAFFVLFWLLLSCLGLSWLLGPSFLHFYLWYVLSSMWSIPIPFSSYALLFLPFNFFSFNFSTLHSFHHLPPFFYSSSISFLLFYLSFPQSSSLLFSKLLFSNYLLSLCSLSILFFLNSGARLFHFLPCWNFLVS